MTTAKESKLGRVSVNKRFCCKFKRTEGTFCKPPAVCQKSFYERRDKSESTCQYPGCDMVCRAGRAPWCPSHKSSKLKKASADDGESDEYDYTDSDEELDIKGDCGGEEGDVEMDADKEVGEGLWDLRADRSEYPTSEEVPVGAAAASVSAERNGKSSTEEALAKPVVEEANTVPLEEVEVEAMDGVQLEEPSDRDGCIATGYWSIFYATLANARTTLVTGWFASTQGVAIRPRHTTPSWRREWFSARSKDHSCTKR